MADQIAVSLVSPERMLATVQASMVEVPGAAGDFTAMPGHAPFLSTLRPGLVRIHGEDGKREYFVTGGFAEVSGEATSILAEEAVERGSLNRAMVEEKIEREQALRETAEGDALIAIDQRLNDFRAAIDQLGL